MSWHSLHRLSMSHGLRPGVVLVHEQGKRFVYQGYRDPIWTPARDRIDRINRGAHLAMDGNGAEVTLTEGAYWRIEGMSDGDTDRAQIAQLGRAEV